MISTMRKLLILFGIALTSCSTSQSAVAEATDPDVVSRAGDYTYCLIEDCEYRTNVHYHIVFNK